MDRSLNSVELTASTPRRPLVAHKSHGSLLPSPSLLMARQLKEEIRNFDVNIKKVARRSEEMRNWYHQCGDLKLKLGRVTTEKEQLEQKYEDEKKLWKIQVSELQERVDILEEGLRRERSSSVSLQLTNAISRGQGELIEKLKIENKYLQQALSTKIEELSAALRQKWDVEKVAKQLLLEKSQKKDVVKGGKSPGRKH